ncbi:MAG: bifunctional folylpolyglutamate synthase/dihydrofolate synthase [Halarcobacter sp.]
MLDFKKASLVKLLEHKTMYYDKIDFSIVEKAWDKLSSKIKLPYVIHIVGTNGKGSTGRFLASYLVEKSFKTLHYSSPHILKFNERIWLNGKNSSDLELEIGHKNLQELLDIKLLEKLTYFEYTTLLALTLSTHMDYLVLEAGLGGEFDATNVVPSDVTLVTTIGLDHQSFLGNTIEEIAKTKLRSVDKKMIIGYQEFDEVFKVANEVKLELKEEKNLDIEIKSVENFDDYKLPTSFANYLNKNLSLVIELLKDLQIEVDTNLFGKTELFGRCQKVLPNVTIDVGHNPLAAKAILNEFKNKKKVHLIYNSYKDKDYASVLSILKPIIDEITIIDIDDRMCDKNNLLEICNNLNIMVTSFSKIENSKNYLIFGSFLVVEKFLKQMGRFNEE